jgi:uncharacterized membrane protein
MPTQVVIGVFFLVLAVIFAVAARADYSKAAGQLTPAVKTRRRVAIIFAVVGWALIIWHLVTLRTQ